MSLVLKVMNTKVVFSLLRRINLSFGAPAHLSGQAVPEAMALTSVQALAQAGTVATSCSTPALAPLAAAFAHLVLASPLPERMLTNVAIAAVLAASFTASAMHLAQEL